MELTRNAPVLDGAGRALGLADVDVIRAYGIALQNDALAREAADGRRACEALLATREEKHLLARANAQLARANEMARADAERARAGLGLLQSQLEQRDGAVMPRRQRPGGCAPRRSGGAPRRWWRPPPRRRAAPPQIWSRWSAAPPLTEAGTERTDQLRRDAVAVVAVEA